jgi:hypothetical protein
MRWIFISSLSFSLNLFYYFEENYDPLFFMLLRLLFFFFVAVDPQNISLLLIAPFEMLHFVCDNAGSDSCKTAYPTRRMD